METDTTLTRPSADVARDLLDAIVSVDLDRMRDLLDADVWLRAMLVREVVQRNDADGVIAAYTEWFGEAHEIELLDASHHSVMLREHLMYRFRLRPSWAPDTWHVIEQTGYARVQDGRVRRLDVVCTGFVPET